MQQAIPEFSKNIRDHIVVCRDLPENECAALARKTFSDTFLDTARSGEHTAHDGAIVTIYADRYKHCFLDKKTRQTIDRERLERLRWILPMIGGQVPGSQCWEKEETDCKRRFYFSFSLGYIVWLRTKDISESGWNLRTAYTASNEVLRRYTIGSKKLAQF